MCNVFRRHLIKSHCEREKTSYSLCLTFSFHLHFKRCSQIKTHTILNEPSLQISVVATSNYEVMISNMLLKMIIIYLKWGNC